MQAADAAQTKLSCHVFVFGGVCHTQVRLYCQNAHIHHAEEGMKPH